MNSERTFHALLSEPGFTPLDPVDLSEALVSFDGDDPEHRAALQAFLARDTTRSEDVVAAWEAFLQRALPDTVGAARARVERVKTFESLSRVREGFRALRADPDLARVAPWAEGCLRALEARRAQFVRILNDLGDGWLDARIDPEEIQSGVARGVFVRPPNDLSDVDQVVFDRWATGALLPEDREALRGAVGTPGTWQDAYRTWVRTRARRVHVVAWHPDLSPSREFATDEWGEGAHIWLQVPLPHLEGSSTSGIPALRVLAHREGTLWHLPGPASMARCVVPYGSPSHRWGDAVLGAVDTLLDVQSPSALEDRTHAVDALAAFVWGQGQTPAVPPEALALARDMASPGGPFVTALARGARAFREGEEGDAVDEATAWAALALRARIALDRLCDWDDGPLLAALLDVDDALDPHADALLLLDDVTWHELTRGEVLDTEHWWGARAALPSPPVELLALAAPLTPPKDPPRVRGGRASTPPLVLHASSASACTQGFVAEVLLPLVDHERREGRVARLQIWHDPSEGLRRVRSFRPEAGNALHDAFREARRLCGERARYPWEEHAVAVALVDAADVQDDGRDVEVDGRSLGLAAVLAFVSCWTEHPIKASVAASARLFGKRLAPINDVQAKRDALLRTLGDDWTLLVHPDDARLLGEDRHVQQVSMTRDALTAAGLPFPVPPFAAVSLSVSARTEELRRLCQAIEHQQTDRYADLGVDPWRVLAERVAWFCDLRTVSDLDEATLHRARTFAALAFVHGGDLESAKAMLEKVPALDEMPDVAVLRGIIALSAAIDVQSQRAPAHGDWSSVEMLSVRLDGLLSGLRRHELRDLRGLALGTQGRALLHAGRPEDALAKLREAWAHHRDELPREALRSSVYFAMALREAGRPLDALAALKEGYAYLDACRRHHPDYAESTLMFWHYERGRTLFALGESYGARDELLEALKASEPRGWWPRLGILRVLAWVERRLGADEESAARISTMEKLLEEVPQASLAFAQRLVAEAKGDPQDACEIY